MAYKDLEKKKKKRRELKKKYYDANPETARQKSRERINRRRLASYGYVNAIKESTPCKDCDRTFEAICMDFDHCKGDKTANVSRLINGGSSLDKIKAEIEKCELVCACCHRIRTRDRQLV